MGVLSKLWGALGLCVKGATVRFTAAADTMLYACDPRSGSGAPPLRRRARGL